jgi:hypothetical protein
MWRFSPSKCHPFQTANPVIHSGVVYLVIPPLRISPCSSNAFKFLGCLGASLLECSHGLGMVSSANTLHLTVYFGEIPIDDAAQLPVEFPHCLVEIFKVSRSAHTSKHCRS